VALTLFLTFGLLVLWEFWLEKLILVDYLEIEVHKNSLDRWTFVVSCLSIVCLSLILPLKNIKNTWDEIKSLRTALHGEQTLSKVFFSVDNSIILIINNSNKIMQINKKTSFLLGYKEDEMLGQDWISLLIPEKSREGLKNKYQQFVRDKNQTFTRFTANVKTKEGTEKFIDWQCSPLRDENGRIYGSINSGQDISEQIRLRGELSHFKGKYEPYLKKLTAELNSNKKKYHNEVIKCANARSRFRFWSELEDTLMNLSAEQIKNQEDIKSRIQKTLKLFGELSNVDHGYVFKFTQSGSHMINTHLWVSGEPMLESDPEEETSLDNFPWFKKNIQKKKVIHIPKVEEIPEEASSEKEVYLSQGIKSLINAPIIRDDSVVGYIGFESNEKEKKWDNDEITLIQAIARLISSITSPTSPTEIPLEMEDILSLEKTAETQPEEDLLPQLSFEETSKKPETLKVPEPEATPTSEAAPPIDKELRKVRESFEKDFQEKIKSMDRAQAKLTAELKDLKEVEADLRSNRDSIERQLKEKSAELESLKAEGGGGGKELNVKLSKKDKEINSLRENFESEKSAKAQLEKNLNEVQTTITKQEKNIEVLETANQVMGAELEELRKVQEEFFTHSIQLEDTQHELESLGIANEQLMSDIKEKNYLIEEAKEKTAHYEQMDLPLFTLDQGGAILSWNHAAEALTGFIPELALNQSISFMFAEKDSFDFKSNFLTPLKENAKHRLEVPIKKFDGEIFKSLISMASFKDRNGIVTTLGYLTNLSDAKNANEIKSIKKQFTTLLGDSGLILLTLSPNYLISDMNDKAESTFQWDREIFLDKNFFEVFLPEEDSEKVSSDIEGRMATQASVDLETQTMLNDNTNHSFLWNLVKEVNPDDESVQGFLAVGQDVSELRNAQSKLRENDFLLKSTVDKAVLLEEKLKENEEKSKQNEKKLKESEKKLKESKANFEETLKEKQYQFEDYLENNDKQKTALREEKLYMVEHITSAVVDLVNNPIQGIGNILGQVKKQAEMADIHKGLVTVAINECRRVADLIGKLKSFQPPTKKNLESLDVHQILDEIIENHLDTVKDRTITLEKHYAKNLPAVDGVTPQIRQAIDNIVKNAEESLSEDEGKIVISTEQDGSNVKIHIQDTGCGIAENDMDRIFDPFFTTKSAIHRPGLGLLTSLGIAKNHKGDIDFHSAPGEGTTFTLTLPLKQSLKKNGNS
jgi:PAS domain S-box-containing protein